MRRPKRSRCNMKTIKLAPKWADLVPWMMRVLEDRTVPEKAKVTVRAELRRLAEFADKVNAQVKKGK